MKSVCMCETWSRDITTPIIILLTRPFLNNISLGRGEGAGVNLLEFKCPKVFGGGDLRQTASGHREVLIRPCPYSSSMDMNW